jgi:transposase InsO family protein
MFCGAGALDSFSRAVELYGLKQANAPSVLECLVDVLSRWGRAAELRCDNAKAFTSAMVTALLKRAKVNIHLTAPYRYESNGQVENCNRQILSIASPESVFKLDTKAKKKGKKPKSSNLQIFRGDDSHFVLDEGFD